MNIETFQRNREFNWVEGEDQQAYSSFQSFFYLTRKHFWCTSNWIKIIIDSKFIQYWGIIWKIGTFKIYYSFHFCAIWSIWKTKKNQVHAATSLWKKKRQLEFRVLQARPCPSRGVWSQKAFSNTCSAYSGILFRCQRGYSVLRCLCTPFR